MSIIYHHRTRGKGAEGVHIMGVVNALRKLGHSVCVLSFPGVDPEAHESAASSKANTERTSPGLFKHLAELTRYIPQSLFELMELAYNLLVWYRLSKQIKQAPVSFIYERYSLFMVAGVWLARRRGIPIILEINDSALVERVRPLVFKRLAQAIERRLLCNADGLVFISSQFRALAQQQYGELAPSVVCPNAADSEQFDRTLCDRNALRHRLGIDQQVVCGYVGAFVYWHGIDRFVQAIAPRLKQAPHLLLLLVGDGVVYQQIEQTIQHYQLQDQIILTGRVPHEQVRDYIAAMDFGILPDSNEYGSPMKLFEMMSMGVASVCPDFPPIAEVVQSKQTGWLFAAKELSEAVDQVLWLADHVDQVRQVGQAAAQYIRTQRQWTHNAQAVLNLIEAR